MSICIWMFVGIWKYIVFQITMQMCNLKSITFLQLYSIYCTYIACELCQWRGIFVEVPKIFAPNMPFWSSDILNIFGGVLVEGICGNIQWGQIKCLCAPMTYKQISKCALCMQVIQIFLVKMNLVNQETYITYTAQISNIPNVHVLRT